MPRYHVAAAHTERLEQRVRVLERIVTDQPLRPDSIWLFRRPILEEWIDRGDVSLGELVSHVLVHELAHHFGWKLDDWERLGRATAIGHLLECVDIMDATGSRDLKLWFSDGTNYPGQDDIVARQDRLAEALAAASACAIVRMLADGSKASADRPMPSV